MSNYYKFKNEIMKTFILKTLYNITKILDGVIGLFTLNLYNSHLNIKIMLYIESRRFKNRKKTRHNTCIINCLCVYVPIGKFSKFSTGSFPFAIFNPNATNHTHRYPQFEETP